MTLPVSFVADVLSSSLCRSELWRFCSLSGELFQCFFILTDRKFFPMVQRKSLVLQVKLIPSCPSYHGDGQKFLPIPISGYFCIDYTAFAFIGASSLRTGLRSRQIQDWQEWVMHEYMIVGLSLHLCQDSAQHPFISSSFFPRKCLRECFTDVSIYHHEAWMVHYKNKSMKIK